MMRWRWAKAVATLLRLANLDLKDAGLLSSGRSPNNAPALVRLAFDRLTLAVIATERGWPLASAAADVSVIPAANPLKAGLVQAATVQPAWQSFPAVGRDGHADPAPDRDVIRAAILATSTLLKDLARRFEVDLLGDKPAGRVFPVRPESVMSPPAATPGPKAELPGRRLAASRVDFQLRQNPRCTHPRHLRSGRGKQPTVVTSVPEPTRAATQIN